MLKQTGAVVIASVLLGATALAHTGVQNPAVLARMDNMKGIAEQMKVLVPIARGQAPFAEDRVDAALADLEAHVAETPELFRAEEHDPRSEALPAIWENYPDFEAKSDVLLDVVRTASASGIGSVEDLVPVIRQIGASCSGCHEQYRIEK